MTEHANQYALACGHDFNTNRLKLGKTQRAILAHLATAPAGLGSRGYLYRGGPLTWHSEPYGIRVPDISTAVYSTQEPTTSQLRVVQRNVRRLEQLGLVDCWHACAGYVDRPYRCVNGEDYVMPQAVAALYVALRWKCGHLDERDRLDAEAAAATMARIDALKSADPNEVLRGLL